MKFCDIKKGSLNAPDGSRLRDSLRPEREPAPRSRRRLHLRERRSIRASNQSAHADDQRAKTTALRDRRRRDPGARRRAGSVAKSCDRRERTPPQRCPHPFPGSQTGPTRSRDRCSRPSTAPRRHIALATTEGRPGRLAGASGSTVSPSISGVATTWVSARANRPPPHPARRRRHLSRRGCLGPRCPRLRRCTPRARWRG